MSAGQASTIPVLRRSRVVAACERALALSGPYIQLRKVKDVKLVFAMSNAIHPLPCYDHLLCYKTKSLEKSS